MKAVFHTRSRRKFPLILQRERHLIKLQGPNLKTFHRTTSFPTPSLTTVGFKHVSLIMKTVCEALMAFEHKPEDSPNPQSHPALQTSLKGPWELFIWVSYLFSTSGSKLCSQELLSQRLLEVSVDRSKRGHTDDTVVCLHKNYLCHSEPLLILWWSDLHKIISDPCPQAYSNIVWGWRGDNLLHSGHYELLCDLGEVVCCICVPHSFPIKGEWCTFLIKENDTLRGWRDGLGGKVLSI